MQIGSREDSEVMFLSCLLNDNTILMEAKVESKMFGRYRPIFDKIIECAKTGKVTKRDILYRNLDEREKELAETIIASPPSYAWEHFQSRIIEHWGRDLLSTAANIAKQQDVEAARQTLNDALAELDGKRSGAKTVTLRDAAIRTLDRIKSGKAAMGILFGIPTIDASTLGARPGQYIVIGARPSQGKSALMAQLVRNQARRHKVGVIQLESDENELSIRILAGEGRIDTKVLIAGDLRGMKPGSLNVAGQGLTEIQDNVFIHDHPGMDLAQFQSVCRSMRAMGCEIIYLDYLQLVKNPGKQSKREEVAEISTTIKATARNLGIPIVALAQLSRDADDKRPTMGTLQHSSQAEQDADQLWLIWHREKENQVTGQPKSWESFIIIDKARDGETRDVPIIFDRPVMNIVEMVPEWKN